MSRPSKKPSTRRYKGRIRKPPDPRVIQEGDIRKSQRTTTRHHIGSCLKARRSKKSIARSRFWEGDRVTSLLGFQVAMRQLAAQAAKGNGTGIEDANRTSIEAGTRTRSQRGHCRRSKPLTSWFTDNC